MESTKPFPPSADKSNFKMIDVAAKPATFRRAVARGTIELSEAGFHALATGTNPKGNVLALAEAAGILAAKKTSDLIPLCHPIGLNSVRLGFELDAASRCVTVFCEATIEAKTGVEMEALCGVNGALLTIYDLSKAVDPVITIRDVRLDLKEGGKSGRWVHPDFRDPDHDAHRDRTEGSAMAVSPASSRPEASPAPVSPLAGTRASVITVSDRVSQGKAEDLSGPEASRFLAALGATLLPPRIVADERAQIAAAIREAATQADAHLVILSGGTGLGPRDITPEVLEELCDRQIPGFGELLRAEGSRHTPMSWLSRSTAGLFGRTLVIALPGSPKAVVQGLTSLRGLLPHALHTARGGHHG